MWNLRPTSEVREAFRDKLAPRASVGQLNPTASAKLAVDHPPAGWPP